MSAKLIVLGSSSRGNGYLLDCGDESLIIECGVSFKALAEATQYDISKIKAAICTHKHKDHAAYIKQYQQHGIPVYSSRDVALKFDGVIEMMPMRKYQLGGFTVIPLLAHHDVECLSFIIDHKSFGRIAFITDSYRWTYKVPNITYWMIEANYDKEIAIAKKCDGMGIRSQSQYHMDINETMNTLKQNHSATTMEVFLIHLSNELSNASAFEMRIKKEIGLDCHAVESNDVFELTPCEF